MKNDWSAVSGALSSSPCSKVNSRTDLLGSLVLLGVKRVWFFVVKITDPDLQQTFTFGA